MGTYDLRADERRAYDQSLVDIANYVADYYLSSSEAFETARHMLLDSVACALLALRYPECAKLLGPIVPGATMAGGARVLGTHVELDPAQAAFAIGTEIGWLDFNDVFVGAETVHPSDGLGAILAVGDWLSRKAQREGGKPVTIRQVLGWAIKAAEIVGQHALKNDLAEFGVDQVILVRVAAAAVVTAMLGGSKDDIAAAASNAWLDGGPLRTYRETPADDTRRGWAAGDACRRAVLHALGAIGGEIGCPDALSRPAFGVTDALFRGRRFEFERGYGSHVIENLTFRLASPGDAGCQAAVEAALDLHQEIEGRFDAIDRVLVEGEGFERLASERQDRSIGTDWDPRSLIALALVRGRIGAADLGEALTDPGIARLRGAIECRSARPSEGAGSDVPNRSVGGSVEVLFRDGSSTRRVEIARPVGHRDRRPEGVRVLMRKFEAALETHLPGRRTARVLDLVKDVMRFEATPVHEFVDLLAR